MCASFKHALGSRKSEGSFPGSSCFDYPNDYQALQGGVPVCQGSWCITNMFNIMSLGLGWIYIYIYIYYVYIYIVDGIINQQTCHWGAPHGNHALTVQH